MIKDDQINYVDSVEKEYFGIKVRAFTSEGTLRSYSSFPWCFEIEFDGKLLQYYGIPNKLETHRKALKRAWYRAKWLSEGTYNQHYR